MLKLKNVSKFYYNKGIITSGFTKINAEFKLGEFIAITGESGSGKSTLVNVISGLDSYEEGELYINGEETSHYSEEDYENYRKKYVSNIFQNFNLVNSYTVYQNIELILLISGYKKKDIKSKVIELIKKVDLYKYRNTKVSKLSGGQKQRVAIARSLAQNTPIIIADEPTGNLDKKSAESVLKTLKAVSKDKLVVIVTHNYEYVEKYATRKITMSDGKIIEDKILKETTSPKDINYNQPHIMPLINKLRLGIRNSYNIPIKFILLIIIFLFMFTGIILETSAVKQGKYESQNMGYNMYLRDLDKKRIIVKKIGNEEMTEEDFTKLSSLKNVEKLVKNDYELENTIEVFNEEDYFDGNVKNINEFNETLTYGRLPQNENEIIIMGSTENYYLSNPEELLEKTFSLRDYNDYTNTKTPDKVKIVGVVIKENMLYDLKFYVNEKIIAKVSNNYNKSRTQTNIEANKNKLYSTLEPLESVPQGSCYISDQLNNSYFYNSYKKRINISATNIYYEENLELKVNKVLTKYNYKTITGNNYNENSNTIYLNPEDYNKLYKKNIYQSSVYISDERLANETLDELEQAGYKGYAVVNMLVNYDTDALYIINIVNIIVLIILLVVLFFISYVIIKIILKSRHTYFTTLRILGSTKKVSKQILEIELFTILNISFLIILLLTYLINTNILEFENLKKLFSFMEIKDYLVVYLIIFVMTYLISQRFARYIFKKSAIKTLNEEQI